RAVVVAGVGQVAAVAGPDRIAGPGGGRRRAAAGSGLALVQVGDVAVGDRYAALLHVGEVGEGLRGGRAEAGEPGPTAERLDARFAVQVDEVAVRVGDPVTVTEEVHRAPAELRPDVPGAEQRLEPVIAARLGRQAVAARSRRRGRPAEPPP